MTTNQASAHRASHSKTTALMPFRSALRWPATLCLVTAAAVHLPLIGEHLSEAPYIGWLFIALVGACLALAAALALHDSRPVWAMAGLVNLLAVIAYLLSRTVGLPQIGDDIGDWANPLGIAAIIAESLTTLLAGTALVRGSSANPGPPPPKGG